MRLFKNMYFLFWFILFLTLSLITFLLINNTKTTSYKYDEVKNRSLFIDKLNLSYANGYSLILSDDEEIWVSETLQSISQAEKFVKENQLNSLEDYKEKILDINSALTVEDRLKLYKSIPYIIYK